MSQVVSTAAYILVYTRRDALAAPRDLVRRRFPRVRERRVDVGGVRRASWGGGGGGGGGKPRRATADDYDAARKLGKDADDLAAEIDAVRATSCAGVARDSYCVPAPSSLLFQVGRAFAPSLLRFLNSSRRI